MKTLIVLDCIMGPTCVGKSFFIRNEMIAAEKAERSSSATHTCTRAVEVGKMLRREFPPEYFQGQMAPEHTQVRAWQLLSEAVHEHIRFWPRKFFPCLRILIDGQPRTPEQVHAMKEFAFSLLKQYDVQVMTHYKYLTAPIAIRRERMLQRDQHNPAAMELTEKRLVNDMVAGHEVLIQLLKIHAHVDIYDTSK